MTAIPQDLVDWKTIALLAIGLHNGLKAVTDSKKDKAFEEMAKTLVDLGKAVTRISTILGLEGSRGLPAEVQTMTQSLDELRSLVFDALNKFAENQGEARGRGDRINPRS